jgi:hypothetical protein
MADVITPEQSAVVARTLFLPTIQRMGILCSSLISTTGNGDFALWAPLTVMEKMLADLKWEQAQAPERFLSLIALTLRRYAEKCDVHLMAVIAAGTAGAPMPEFAVWTDADTMSVYDQIDAQFPAPAVEPEPDAPPAPGGQGTATAPPCVYCGGPSAEAPNGCSACNPAPEPGQ